MKKTDIEANAAKAASPEVGSKAASSKMANTEPRLLDGPKPARESRAEITAYHEAIHSHLLPLISESQKLTTQGRDTAEFTVQEEVTLSFSRELPARVLLPHVIADRAYLMAKGKDGDMQINRFESVLLPGQWHLRRLLATDGLRVASDKLFVVGSPRVDFLREKLATHVATKRDGKDLTVLWAPGNSNWFDAKGNALGSNPKLVADVSAIEEICDLRLVVHPRNREDKSPVIDDLLDADVVISDYSSVIYEAWALGKPVIFPRWRFGKTLLRHAPRSAEAHILRERIGYHPASLAELLDLLRGRLTVGDDVHAFMSDFLENYRSGSAIETAVSTLRKLATVPRVITPEEVDSLIAEKSWPDAESKANMLIAQDESVGDHYDRLAMALRGQRKWWQEIEALKEYLKRQHTPPATVFYRLGEALEAMGRNREASRAYSDAIKTGGSGKVPPEWHYRLGYVLETDGHDGPGSPAAAKTAYAAACAADKTLFAARFGIGAFHQARGYWGDARRAYASTLHAALTEDAELYYRLGMACDRGYDWPEAEKYYRLALRIDPARPNWAYRLGFVLERQARFLDAAEAYRQAISINVKHMPYWYYRLGYVLEKAGKPREACGAFLRLLEKPAVPSVLTSEVMPGKAVAPGTTAQALSRLEIGTRTRLSEDMTNPDTWFQLAHKCLAPRGEWEEAVDAYRAAIARKNDHTPSWYYALGTALTMLRRFDEACEAFRSYRVLQSAHGLSEDSFNKNVGFKRAATYLEYSNLLPISKNTVLYESFFGASMTCNPLAIFRKLLNDPSFADYTHVWTIENIDAVPIEYRTRRNVIFVRKESDLYHRFLSTANYLINNTTFPSYFLRRDQQFYLNTWHGTPWKFLGTKSKIFMDHKNTQRNFLQATHLISPNAHTTDVLTSGYDLGNCIGALVGEIGSPRVDLTLNMTLDQRNALKLKLGIKSKDRVILYAPTFRGTVQQPMEGLSGHLAEIEMLKSQGCHVLFRGHHFVEDSMGGLIRKVNIVPKEVPTNDLLAIVDVLITDYSSIAFDFMATGREIKYLLPDIEDYERDRGLYFASEEMPGEVYTTMEQVVDSLSRVNVAAHENYAEAQKKFCPLEDGHASERVVDFFFSGVLQPGIKLLEPNRSGRKGVVLYPGNMLANGITTSTKNLLASFDRAKFYFCLAIDPVGVAENEGSLSALAEIPSDVGVIPKVGRGPRSVEEQWIESKIGIPNMRLNDEMNSILQRMYESEYFRTFGNAKFDVVVDFCGYSRIWSSILAARPNVIPCYAFLHNEMLQEMDGKYPWLKGIFDNMHRFDGIISVSRLTNDTNRASLAEKFGIASEKFDYVENSMDLARINALSREPLSGEDGREFFGSGPVFLKIARLSVEKGHDRLIRAFKEVQAKYPTAKLAILGDGPLMNPLRALVSELGLDSNVRLFGRRENPFKYFLASSCLVMSSFYEGQPLVVLEAMILGLPVVSTDYPGIYDLLDNGRFGKIVESSEEGLKAGMLDFLAGKITCEKFDAEAYQRQARDMFYTKVCGLPATAPAELKAV